MVPRAEVDHWLDLEVALAQRCTAVAHAIGRAQQRAFGARRVGLVIAGFEVPHAHVHVFPADTMGDFDFAHVDQAPDPAGLHAAAEAIRGELTALGHPEASA